MSPKFQSLFGSINKSLPLISMNLFLLPKYKDTPDIFPSEMWNPQVTNVITGDVTDGGNCWNVQGWQNNLLKVIQNHE